MAREQNGQLALSKEMEEIESTILARTMEVESLKEKRYELLAKKEDLQIQEVIECAIEIGVSSEELLKFVLKTSKEKEERKE